MTQTKARFTPARLKLAAEMVPLVAHPRAVVELMDMLRQAAEDAEVLARLETWTSSGGAAEVVCQEIAAIRAEVR